MELKKEIGEIIFERSQEFIDSVYLKMMDLIQQSDYYNLLEMLKEYPDIHYKIYKKITEPTQIIEPTQINEPTQIIDYTNFIINFIVMIFIFSVIGFFIWLNLNQ
jgi:hypothetical protein